ncbi:hypothetical protein [Yeosuana sp. AK3]
MKIKTTIILLFIALILTSCNHKKNEYKSYNEYPVSHENLWLDYTENYTIFIFVAINH